ncbi:MAG: lysophospholipid acyltransferase family protein [Chloroflexota bacterium]|nr:lysophospholipid acyltransferase family protein [Chloroflexota bacterium]
MLHYWAWQISNWIWRLLPPQMGYACARWLADIVYLAWTRGRLCARENMAHVMGPGATPRQVDRMARQSLRNYCCYLVDMIHFPLLKNEEIERLVVFDGWENLDEALKRGKGAIFIGLHLGNWDLAAAAICLRRYPLNAIVDTFSHPKLNEMVIRTRSDKGLKVIPRERATSAVVRALRRNEILALLIDRPSEEEGVEVNFCGSPVRVPAGAATLALRTGALVVTGALVRQPDNSFLGLIERNISFEPSGHRAGDVQALTQHIMNSLEKWVRQYPDQWYMFRPMWRPSSCSPIGP